MNLVSLKFLIIFVTLKITELKGIIMYINTKLVTKLLYGFTPLILCLPLNAQINQATEREQQILALLHKISGSTTKLRYELSGQVNLHNLIQNEADKNDVPAAFVASVITIESASNPCARSNVGAEGIMQIMPDTARKHLKIRDPFDPVQGVRGGVQYLSEGLKSSGSTIKASARYHAGPKGLVKPLTLLPKSTQLYVAKVDLRYKQYKKTGWKRKLPKYIKKTNKYLCRKKFRG